MQVSTLLEFLHTDNKELLHVGYTIEQLEHQMAIIKSQQQNIIDKLTANYWPEISNICEGVYSHRSKYTYIKSGIDFLNHVRTKCGNIIDIDIIYENISLLYAYEYLLHIIKITVSAQTIQHDLDIDTYVSLHPPTIITKRVRIK